MSADYYDRNADKFIQDTLNLDLSHLWDPFLAHIATGGHILDAGCGSGRDTKAFLERGYRVTAFDASPTMAAFASKHTGITVEVKRFDEVCEVDVYDGIWANASLLHVPPADLASVIGRFAVALKAGGVMFVSFKYGTEVRVKEDRKFTDLTETELQEIIGAVPSLALQSQLQSQDVRSDRSGERWLNALLSKR